MYTCSNPALMGIQQILQDTFREDFLYLSFTDFEGINYDKWAVLLEKIKNTVDKNNIQLIVIDKTGDPDLLDKEIPIAPSYLQIRQELSTIVPTYIVTEDYTYHYHPEPNIIFFPYTLWLFGTKSIGKYYKFQDTVYDTSLEKTQMLMCLNRNMEWHRIYLFSLIANRPWFNQIEYSFIFELGNRLDSIQIKEQLTEEECNTVRMYQHLLPIKLREESEEPARDIPFMYNNAGGSVNRPVYTNSAINVVTETSLTNGITITEKTCKAIMAYQIPIIVGPTGVTQYLNDVGIDMFDDYIPWRTWDNLSDHKLKIRMIVEFLDTILSSPTAQSDILAVHNSFKSRLIKNKERFHSPEFGEMLYCQLKSYTS